MIQDISPRKFHIEYVSAQPSDGDFMLCFDREMRGIYIKKSADASESITFPLVGEVKYSGEARYLFSIDDTRFFFAEDADCAVPDDFEAVGLRQLRHAQPGWLAFAGAVGFRLRTWYRDNRFCGRCGAKLRHSETERAMVCPDCGNVIYPTICPSVIVAVTNGDRLLLTRYQRSHSVYQNYALCAGYIETGETAEDAVRREIMEEVGLRVRNIRYYKSQPWPFSGALLIGFFCEVDGSDVITRDDSELSEAVWVARADIPDRSNDVSMTSEMIELFRQGHEPKPNGR